VYNHALAMLHSRLTVAAEMVMTAAHVALIHEPDEGLVDQRCRLQGVIVPLPAQIARGLAPELAVDDRQQVVERLILAGAQVLQQCGDVRR